MGIAKKLVRPLLAGAGVVGGLAAANRALQNAPLPTNALGGTRVPWTWRGHEIFATQAGDGPPVVLVHAISSGASSYEFRNLFPLLAQRNRVVAFDLLGCGLSEKPNLAYTTELFVEQIVDAIRTFCGGAPATLIGSSLGAAFAIRAAAREHRLVERLVAICPTGVNGTLDRSVSPRGRALSEIVRSPLLGEALYNTLASKRSARWFLEHEVYGDAARVTPDVIAHYYAVTHQPGARYVPAAFFGGALNCDIVRDLPFLSVALLVLWGEKAPTFSPRSNADEIVRLVKNARLVTFPSSGLLPHEEEPEAVDEAISEFTRQPA